MVKLKTYVTLLATCVACLWCQSCLSAQYPAITISGQQIVNGNSITYWLSTSDNTSITDKDATNENYNLMYNGIDNTLYLRDFELQNCTSNSVIEIDSPNDINLVITGTNSIIAQGNQKGISIINHLCSCKFSGNGTLSITTENGIGIYSYSGSSWQANNNTDVLDITDTTINVISQKGLAVSVNGITVRGTGKLICQGAYTAIHSVNSGIHVTDNGFLKGTATATNTDEFIISDRIAGIYVNDSNGNDIIADKNGIIIGSGKISNGIRTWHGGIIVKDNALILGASDEGIAINTFGNTYRVEGNGTLKAFSLQNYGISTLNSYIVSGGQVLICGGKAAIDTSFNKNTLRASGNYNYTSTISTEYSGLDPFISFDIIPYTSKSKYILIEPYSPIPVPTPLPPCTSTNHDTIDSLPQTGDTSHLLLWLMLLTFAGLSLLTLKHKAA